MISWFMKDALWYANQRTLTESKKKKKMYHIVDNVYQKCNSGA